VLFQTENLQLSAGVVAILYDCSTDKLLSDKFLVLGTPLARAPIFTLNSQSHPARRTDGFVPFLTSLLSSSRESISATALYTVSRCLLHSGTLERRKLALLVAKPVVALGRRLDLEDKRLFSIVDMLSQLCLIREVSNTKTVSLSNTCGSAHERFADHRFSSSQGINVDETLDFLVTCLTKP